MSEIRVVEHKELGEKYYTTVHKSGLEITLIPKDFSENYALFTTRYGGCDNCFKLEGEKEFTHVPDGIAHYLEHKMFESETGEDTFARFARYGANANAFTSNNMTAYLFGATENFKENLEILLDFVTHPYFTKENVEKEQGIIGQEIKMYEDDPNRAVYMNMLDALYKDNQIKIKVVGTVESIAQITPELLYSCYNTFYNLSNMMLVVSGRATMEEILEVCDKVLKEREPVRIVRHYNDEPSEVNKKRVEARFAVSKPIFSIGVKMCNADGDMTYENARRDLLFELIFGSTSEISLELYESGLVPDLHYFYEGSKICAYGVIGGGSDDPEKAYEKIVSYIEKKKREGFDERDFDRVKRARFAETVRTFDSTHVPDAVTFFKIDDADIYKYIECIKNIKFEDMAPLARELFKEERMCMSVVYPIKDKEE